MLTKNDKEWFQYQSRLMAERDERTRLKELAAARQEAREARQQGEVIGGIQVCQRLLKQQLTPSDELAALPLQELHAKAALLEKQLGVAEK